MRDFRKLEIWKESIFLCTEIYKLTETYPNSEKYGLVSQMRRSAISISSNIAEGCRGSNKELKQFLNISLGSSFELETQIEISKNVLELNHDLIHPILERINVLQKRINAFRNTIF